jgi:hypothetical protein
MRATTRVAASSPMRFRQALEPLERAAAKARMSEGGKGVKVSQPCRATEQQTPTNHSGTMFGA